MVDSFLSEVIRRNRPRAVLFSPHQSPSYRYKLAAFAHQDVADCAFVSTHKRWLNERLLAKFKVRAGAKDLVVFTEENSSLHLEVSTSIDMLKKKQPPQTITNLLFASFLPLHTFFC